MLLRLIMVLTFANSCYGQVLVSSNISFNRVEMLQMIQANAGFYDAIDIELGIGFGARSLYMQHDFRPFASFFVGKSFDLTTSNIKLMPKLGVLFGQQSLSSNNVMNSELAAGYTFIAGRKWKLLHGATFGRGRESIQIGVSQLPFNYWAYSVFIGIGYEF